ncbi:MAG TPA: hypothetical protein VGQ57_03275, partial [Polyangiaceae bacterium]|nr:hypothetical protein [Polyangiaceae bacterium]
MVRQPHETESAQSEIDTGAADGDNAGSRRQFLQLGTFAALGLASGCGPTTGGDDTTGGSGGTGNQAGTTTMGHGG